MAKEKMGRDCLTIAKNLETLVANYNKLVADEKTKAKTLENALEAIREEEKEYALKSKLETYAKLKDTKEPMLEAVKLYFIPTKKMKKSETGFVLADDKKPINFVDFDKKVCGRTGLLYLNALNSAMYMKMQLDLTGEVQNKTDYMRKLEEEIKLGKNPLAQTNFVKTISKAVASLIGDTYAFCENCDVNFLKSIYLTKDKKAILRVVSPNAATFASIIAAIAHRMVRKEAGENAASYVVETKEKLFIA